MSADPRVRRDGNCAKCGKPRKMPTNRLRGVDPDIYAADPFCSSVCARLWYGNPLPKHGTAYDSLEMRGRHERSAA